MRSPFLAGLVVAASLVLAACGGAASPAASAAPSAAPEPSRAPASGPTTGGVAVTIEGFILPEVTAAVGQEVTWTNADSTGHTVTLDDGLFDEPIAGGGGTVSNAFDTAGTFAYHCKIHPSMTGTITIS
jgi:plastocyanin